MRKILFDSMQVHRYFNIFRGLTLFWTHCSVCAMCTDVAVQLRMCTYVDLYGSVYALSSRMMTCMGHSHTAAMYRLGMPLFKCLNDV